MIHSSRSAFARSAAALAFGLLVLVAVAAGGDEPTKKARPSKLETELGAFRALGPADRLTLVLKLAGAKEPFTAAKRGDLTATIVERGTIEPVDYADLTCKLKANGKGNTPAATIKWVIDDGIMVKKGQRVLILDDSALHDLLKVAGAKVRESEEALDLASENIRLVQKENAIEVRLAEIDVKLAEIELKELPAGKPKEVPELRVEQAKLKLERAGIRAKTQLAQAWVEKRARAAAKGVEVERLKDIEAELKQCSLLAPMDGMLVYLVPPAGRLGGGLSPIAAGETVREGQKLPGKSSTRSSSRRKR